MYMPLLADAARLSDTVFRQALMLGNYQSLLIRQGQNLAAASDADFATFIQQLLAGEGCCAALWQDIASLAQSATNDGLTGVSADRLRKSVIAMIIRRATEATCWSDDQFYPVCRIDDLHKPGDYVTAEVCGDSILVVLNQKQQIRAFYNICPHRYNRLLTGKSHLAGQQIQCGYHGWRFDLDGHCQFVPLVKTFGPDFCQADQNLEPLDCRIEQGQVCVRPAQSAATGAKADMLKYHQATDIASYVESDLPERISLWQPPLPEPLRVSIRLGYLEAELGRTGREIAEQQGIDLQTLLRADSDGHRSGEFRALHSARRQLLLVLHEICSDGSIAASDARIVEQSTQHATCISRPAPTVPDNILNDCQQPEEPLEALPLWTYDDAELYALEVEQIIKPAWQFVGHECEIPAPGSQCRLYIAGESILVSRQASGELLAERVIAGQTDKTERIDIDNWEGFLFVRIAAGGGPPMQAHWDRKEGLLSPYFQNLSPIRGASWYDIAIPANYKFVWENYLEVYHFPLVHKGRHRLCKPVPDSPFWPLRRELSGHATPDEREYHARIFASGEHSLEDEAQLIRQAEKTRKLDRRLNYSLFGASPNQHVGPVLFGFTCFPEHVNVNSIIPAGPDECYFRSRCYQFPLNMNSQRGKDLLRAQQINTERLLQAITEEDIVLNLRCQSVAGSRQFRRTGILSAEEDAIMYFQNYLRQRLPVTRLRQRPVKGTVRELNDVLLQN
ncbi:MAG: Rieske 2Fe-2S domain-containing protein [Pseudomonadota bacterium]